MSLKTMAALLAHDGHERLWVFRDFKNKQHGIRIKAQYNWSSTYEYILVSKKPLINVMKFDGKIRLFYR